ncbi:MAG: dimethylsulfonioproprionate lyase family protein [Pseudomonadota bacterium]
MASISAHTDLPGSGANALEPAARLIRALSAALGRRAPGDPALAPFASALGHADLSTMRPPHPGHDGPPGPALSGLAAASATDHAVAAAAAAAIPRLAWRRLYEGRGIDRKLGQGLMTAQALGTWGAYPSDAVSAGFLSFAPGLQYPLHTHPAPETYYCLAGRITLQHGREGTPFTLGPGALSLTPPNRVHRLETGTEPALLMYVWLGSLDGPTWWWSQRENARWTRTAWRRAPGRAWEASHVHFLTPAILAEAGET